MRNLLKIFFSLVLTLSYAIAIGATAVEKFDIQVSPSKVKVGESVDITIKALDKDGNVVKDYVGEILIFSQSDPKAEFPGILNENTYKFKTSDAGVVKFENALKFTKTGIQDVNVYDIANEEVFGIAEVEVVAGEASITSQKGEISIKSPENGVTLGSDKVKVSGLTSKNHRVKIILNGDKEIEAISNSEGVFETELVGVPSGENSLFAKLLDADGNVIGESSKILFKVESNAPKFKSIKITPEGEVAGGTVLNVELEASKGLTEVSVVLNDLIQKLTPSQKDGIYTGTITAPKENGDYKIDVILKNEIGIETKESGVKTITVKNIELASAPTETGTQVNCDDLKKELVIKNVKLIKMRSKSILSWDKVEKATGYNLYKRDKNGTGMTLIRNLTENQVEINIEGDQVAYDDFAIKAVLKNEYCDIEGDNYSVMTRVQTGPRELTLMIISLLIAGVMFFLLRKRQS